MKSFLKLAAINLAVLCTLLVVIEVSGQFLFYLVKGHSIFSDKPFASDEHRHHELFEYHPYQVGRLKKNVSVTFDGMTMSSTEFHTRVTGAPEEDEDCIRIAALGGSTTFGTKVSDEDSWPAQLQKKLGPGYSVRNYGGPGFSTAEAIVQLALSVPEWKPHYVILYQGWNDIRNYHNPNITPDYYSHGSMQLHNLRIPLYRKRSFLREAAEVSATFKILSYIQFRLMPSESGQLALSRERDATVDAIYQRNLKTLKALSDHISAVPIFIPQVLNDAYLRETERVTDGWVPHIRLSDMPELMSQFNELMTDICVGGEKPCYVLDSVLAVDWQRTDFVDRGHFSFAGGDKFSDEIVSLIRRLE